MVLALLSSSVVRVRPTGDSDSRRRRLDTQFAAADRYSDKPHWQAASLNRDFGMTVIVNTSSSNYTSSQMPANWRFR